MKPLDLQVNMNTIIEVSRVQGERNAREFIQQRNIDDKAILEARLRTEQVNQAAESTASGALTDTEKHFGAKTDAEIEADEFNKDQPKKDEKDDQHENSEDNESNDDRFVEDTDPSDGHINMYA